MENTTTVILTLEDINDQEIKKLLVPIVYLAILMTVGIPGNLAVLIIYRHKYSKSVYRTIIWNLALTDLVFCTLTIPINIGRLVRYYTFTELWVCKLITTTITFFIMYSSHLIVTLSIHRFRQVCLPLRNQIGPQDVKYWIIGGACLAVFLDIPLGILQPIDHVQLAQNITGHICAISYHPSLFAEIYNGFLTFLFSLYSLVLFVLYILIGRRMYLQRKSKQYSKSSLSQSDEVSSKITKIAITVSVVFAFSYVPLYVIKLLTSKINQEELTSAQFAVLKIVERSYVINHVANPFIYAFFDSRFRREFKKMFTAAGRPPEMEGTSEERTASKDRTLNSNP